MDYQSLFQMSFDKLFQINKIISQKNFKVLQEKFDDTNGVIKSRKS